MNRKGVTLLELVVAMGISAILIGAIYGTFIRQHNTFNVQDQVADTQQNARTALNRLTREIRMAGFGGVPAFFASGKTWKGKGGTPNVSHIIIPGATDDTVTVVAAYEQVTTLLSIDSNPRFVKLGSTAEFKDNLDNRGRQYICFNGLETRRIEDIPTSGRVKLDSALIDVHPPGEPVYRVVGITYRLDGGSLKRNRNISGEDEEIIADNIASLIFRYWMRDGSQRNRSELNPVLDAGDPLSFVNIRAVDIGLIARTERQDPQMAGGSFRTRELWSTVQLRNLGPSS